MLKTAAITLKKETIQGKYGPFEAYVVSGDTYAIKDSLKSMGFSWYGPKQAWWISSKRFSTDIQQRLSQLGISSSPSPIPTSSSSPQESVQTPPQPAKKEWVTEDAEMSAWYGFPMNKKIATWESEVEVDGQKHKVIVTIDRSFKKGISSSYYRQTKSREHKGFPRYLIDISVPDFNYVRKLAEMSKQKWGTYDEEQYIENTLKPSIEQTSIKNPNSKLNHILHDIAEYSRRDPAYKQFLKDIGEEKIDLTYDFTINDPLYSGNYKVGIYDLGMDEKSFYTTLKPVIDRPNVPKDTFGYENVEITNTYTIEDFHNKIRQYLSSNHDKIQKDYIEYLQSFPYLESQQKEARQGFDIINAYIMGQSDPEAILRRLQEKGYIRPHKHQKQGPGLTTGEEIRWVIDSKKIVDDAYSMGSYLSKTPEYFYSVVAYYVHRKIRGIWSWTDMALMDAMNHWFRTMRGMGATFDFETAERIIEQIGNYIVNKIYGKETKEQQNERFRRWFEEGSDGNSSAAPQSFGALEEFVKFVEQFGIDAEGINEQNAKKIYRTIVQNIHPDKFPDPDKKAEMTEKFKDLQAIWERVPESYKMASNWYERFIFG